MENEINSTPSIIGSKSVVVTEPWQCQQLRKALAAAGLQDRRRRPVVSTLNGPKTIYIPVQHITDDERRRLSSLLAAYPGAQILDHPESTTEVNNKMANRKTEDKLRRLREAVGQLVDSPTAAEQLVEDMPATFELFDEGMLLLPAACLRSPEFEQHRKPVLDLLCDTFRQVKVIGWYLPVSSFRRNYF